MSVLATPTSGLHRASVLARASSAKSTPLHTPRSARSRGTPRTPRTPGVGGGGAAAAGERQSNDSVVITSYFVGLIAVCVALNVVVNLLFADPSGAAGAGFHAEDPLTTAAFGHLSRQEPVVVYKHPSVHQCSTLAELFLEMSNVSFDVSLLDQSQTAAAPIVRLFGVNVTELSALRILSSVHGYAGSHCIGGNLGGIVRQPSATIAARLNLQRNAIVEALLESSRTALRVVDGTAMPHSRVSKSIEGGDVDGNVHETLAAVNAFIATAEAHLTVGAREMDGLESSPKAMGVRNESMPFLAGPCVSAADLVLHAVVSARAGLVGEAGSPVPPGVATVSEHVRDVLTAASSASRACFDV